MSWKVAWTLWSELRAQKRSHKSMFPPGCCKAAGVTAKECIRTRDLEHSLGDAVGVVSGEVAVQVHIRIIKVLECILGDAVRVASGEVARQKHILIIFFESQDQPS